MSGARQVRVLLVEDNPTDVLLLRESLPEMAGVVFSVTHAERLDECLRLLGQEPFDVALVDLGLPDSSGLETFKRVHALAPEMPALVLTGLEDDETGLSAVQLGAQDYLMKSHLQEGVLTSKVRYAIERQELRRIQRREDEHARHAQKMEAVGQLAAGLGHDFNNLLTVINGYSDLLSREEELSPLIRKRIAAIHDSCLRARKLTRQLLAFSRKNVSCPEILSWNDILTGMTPLLESLVGDSIEVRLSLLPGLGSVRADPGELEQLVMNLALNARDAMAGSGVLTIATEDIEAGAPIAKVRSGLKPGPHVMLAVRDTGSGIDQDTLARIFEPFFTTKEVGKGTGLGLATAYGIAAGAGGEIFAESKPGEGAIFRVLLPRAVGNTVAKRPSPSARPDASCAASLETILLAEDDDGVRELVCDVLRPLGYCVIPTRDGAEALVLWPSVASSVDLLLTDLRMPTVGGAELAQTLLRENPRLKVLFMAGYIGGEVGWNETAFARARVLAKPFAPDLLAASVREALDSREARPVVLVVDDMAEVRNLLRDVLEAEGLLVDEASDGRQALAMMSKRPCVLAIIDLVMPEMEGIETIRGMRQMNPAVRILAMSGYVDNGDYLRAAKLLGTDGILPKPLEIETLLTTVRDLMAPRARPRAPDPDAITLAP